MAFILINPEHDPKQHLRGFNCWSDTLGNDASTVIFKPYKST